MTAVLLALKIAGLGQFSLWWLVPALLYDIVVK